MIQISHLTLTHKKDLTDLVADLSLTIHPGDKVAIIGEEGNGKSSLLNYLMDPKRVSSYLEWEGETQRHFKVASYIPQQLPDHLAKQTLLDYFFTDPDISLDYGNLYRYTEELHFNSDRLGDVQTLATLSGGEQLKIQLLKELARESDILFLDEPSNDLDLATLTWLENFIKQSPKTIVFVSHDESFLSQTATKIVHLERLKRRQLARTTVRTADYQTYSQERTHLFNKQEHLARKEQQEHQKKLDRHHRLHQSVEHTVRNTHDATAGRLVAKKMKAILAQERRFEKEASKLTERPLQEDPIRLTFSKTQPLPNKKTLVEFKNDPLKIESRLLVASLNFQFHSREKIGLIGPNGMGKSTLLKQIYQQLRQQDHYPIGYMPQDYSDLLNHSTSPLQFLSQSAEERDIRNHLANLQFTREEILHPIASLSGGQHAKLLLLKLVLDQAPVLLLDEPTRNFSPTSQPQIRQLFQEYPGAILTVSHDRSFLKTVCNRIIQLDETGLTEVDKDHL